MQKFLARLPMILLLALGPRARQSARAAQCAVSPWADQRWSNAAADHRIRSLPMGNRSPSAIDERPQLIALFRCIWAALTLKSEFRLPFNTAKGALSFHFLDSFLQVNFE
jgi:hypothetical protein